jgi:chemotaxis protein MotB
MSSQSKSKRNKKHRHEEHENHERWLVSYADFITLLFAFFVVMYATSNVNEGKQKNFEDSIKTKFKLVAVTAGEGKKANSIDDALEELHTPVLELSQHAGAAETADYVERSLDKSMSASQKKSLIQNITHDAIGARVALASSSFFQSGSAKLKIDALSALDKVAEVLKSNDRKIIVEGHTDDTPISDSQFPSNWELAGTRASAVIRYLTKVHKIAPQRMVSISYGDQKPLVPNDTEENRAQNRRIEILIVTDNAKVSL